MKLDDTSKVVSIISVIIGIIGSVAAVVTNLKAQEMADRLNELERVNKSIDIRNKSYNLSSRITARFELPLARSFAEQYLAKVDAGEPLTFAIPIPELYAELQQTIPKWKERRGLMTGKPCEAEGLQARQVITLLVKNIGFSDAFDVAIKARYKVSPHPDPTRAWQELSRDKKPLAFYDLQSPTNGWTTITMPLEDLHGQSSPEADRNEIQVVLASVSGSTNLFGTVVVPLEISWTDKMTNKRQTQPILPSQVAKVRSALLGAEIGSLQSACR